MLRDLSRVVRRVGLVEALLLAAGTFAQSDIPIDAQAKILNTKITDALRSKNYQAMISDIEQYRKLGSIFPNELLVTEAQAAYLSGDPARALSALKDYLKIAKKLIVTMRKLFSCIPRKKPRQIPKL
jgi:outer membrane protein assembly factor BamD (BamD/ComL family)